MYMVKKEKTCYECDKRFPIGELLDVNTPQGFLDSAICKECALNNPNNLTSTIWGD